MTVQIWTLAPRDAHTKINSNNDDGRQPDHSAHREIRFHWLVCALLKERVITFVFPRFLQVMMALMGIVILALAMMSRVKAYTKLVE
jgi:hypothetical protein